MAITEQQQARLTQLLVWYSQIISYKATYTYLPNLQVLEPLADIFYTTDTSSLTPSELISFQVIYNLYHEIEIKIKKIKAEIENEAGTFIRNQAPFLLTGQTITDRVTTYLSDFVGPEEVISMLASANYQLSLIWLVTLPGLINQEARNGYQLDMASLTSNVSKFQFLVNGMDNYLESLVDLPTPDNVSLDIESALTLADVFHRVKLLFKEWNFLYSISEGVISGKNQEPEICKSKQGVCRVKPS